MVQELLKAYLADQLDLLLIGLLALSILNIWKHKTILWVNYLFVPLLATYGLYLFIPSYLINNLVWLWAVLFISLLLIDSHRIIPLPAKNHLGSFFLVLALGILIIRSLFWGYFLFNSAIKERLGSFRMEGVVWAKQQTHAWQFSHLQALIDQHWYYPSSNLLYSKPYPSNAQQLLAEGIKAAEEFRQSLLAKETDAPSQMELLADAMIKFQNISTPILDDRPNLEHFELYPDEMLEAVQGVFGTADVALAFSYFQGHWFGLWTDTPVDHEWRHLYIYNPPQYYPEANVNITLSQYAWIGDGFGWNLYAHQPETPNVSYILGVVYHVRDQDPNQIVQLRPHVGIDYGLGKIIWITASEVFFEETIPPNDETPDHYAISGFEYEIDTENENNEVLIKKSFQAIYTRNPNERPPFFEFNLNESM